VEAVVGGVRPIVLGVWEGKGPSKTVVPDGLGLSHLLNETAN